MTVRARSVAGAALAAYVAFVLVVLLWPTPVDAPVDGTLVRVLDAAHRHGLPAVVDYATVEVLANVAMFVPVGALLAAALPARRRWWAIVICILLSACAEGAQALLLPSRFASLGDVEANATGGLLGWVIAVIVIAVVARGRSATREAPTRPTLKR
jgi:VanZ family protein